MICEGCGKKVQELYTKSEYIDIKLSEKQRKILKKELEGKWLCEDCWNKVIIKHNLPKYEIIKE